MPHQCTNCGKTFPDGSKEMLSGCPECGGNKFQFRPSSSLPSDAEESPATPTSDADESAPTSAPDSRSESNAAASTSADATPSPEAETPPTDAESTASGADTSADELPSESTDSSTDDTTDPTTGDADPTTGDPTAADEDSAQASARRDVVEPDELAGAVEREARDRPPRDSDGRVIEPESDDRPGLDELREELNDQFESIKIVNPGQYELNLMELYDRDEYIISLQEDGRYVIEVPDTWRGTEDDEN